MQTFLRISTVCLCLFVATVFSDVKAMEQERPTNINNTLIVETCAKESNVTFDELNEYLSEDEPNEYKKNHTMKCAARCILQKRGVLDEISNGRLSIGGLILYGENNLKSSQLIKSTYNETMVGCFKKARSVADNCEMALTYERCFNKQFAEAYGNNALKVAEPCTLEVLWKSAFNRSSTFNASKCAAACYYRKIEWMVNGVLVWESMVKDLEMIIDDGSTNSSFEAFAPCAKKVEAVTDECEKGYIINNCVNAVSEIEDSEEKIENSGRSKRNVLSQKVDGTMSKIFGILNSSLKNPEQTIL